MIFIIYTIGLLLTVTIFANMYLKNKALAMNNILLHILILLCTFAVKAQEKVKGNRIVTTRTTEINAFHTINLDEDFEVEIIFNQMPSVEIEADENLHNYIEFKVVDSVLTFDKNARIRSKKALNIKVAYNRTLKQIKTSDDAEILSLVTLDLPELNVMAKASSKVGLTAKTNSFNLGADNRARVELNLTSDSTSMLLSGNSKLEALINTVNFSGTLYQRADAEIEGSCNVAKLEMDNFTQFGGKNFTINKAQITCNIGSEAELEVMENITIEASGSSSISLYENPQIIIEKMADTSRLQKKVK